ncbi:unnamed protein product [Calicophoron daubneyi]|uniref:Transposase domain-containing protein n=1 Tax=Calicophoron daubneyi TaxID=300641 RepID=A0AAV2T5S1_CALDB
MKTPRVTDLRVISPGKYGHYGLQQALEKIAPNALLHAAEYVSLQFNVDGMKPFKDTNMCMWPILGRIIYPVVTSPFLVGLYSGSTKPEDVNFYLSTFVQELLDLLKHGVRVAKSARPINVRISCFVCDSPARAYIKRKVTHTGYSSCDHCVQKGIYVAGKVTFPLTNCPLRTDAAFRSRSDSYKTILECLPIDMINDFPLDYMHCVCLGVTKRVISKWLDSANNAFCIDSASKNIVHHRIMQYRGCLKPYFTKVCRTWNLYRQWHAVEFRQFLLYLGPVVLRDAISTEYYDNFMHLSIGIYLLSHPAFYKTYNGFSHSCLIKFIESAYDVYGAGEMVYNVHSLIRNILSRLISPAMSEEIHCGGKDKPFLFKNSRIYGFLLDQVNKRTAFSSVDSKTVSYEARLWFRLRREQMKGKPQEVSFLCLLQCISISSRVPNLPTLIFFRW